MPDVEFRANVTWRNDLLWPASLYGARVPAGLPETSVRAPLYVTAAEMQRLSPSRTIRVVAGQARQDQYVRQYLLEGAPVDDGMFRNWFRGDGFQTWIKNGIWAPEHNRRGEQRDSGPDWQRYRERIDSLMRTGR